jgi:PDZ domain-containing protein
VLVVAVLLVAGAFSLTYKLNLYSITPGLSQPVGPLITVSGQRHDIPRRTILLTDVYLTQLTVWGWLGYEFNHSHEQIVSGSDLVDPGVSQSELQAQGYLEMADAKDYARAAGMRALGLKVTGTPAGVTVAAVGSASPNAGVIGVADRIIAVDHRTVATVCGLQAALSGLAPGERVPARVEVADISGSGTITYNHPSTVTMVMGKVPAGATQTGCPGNPTRTVTIGIEPEQAYDWHFPVDVSINTADIGGPSAGLAMTLGIIDALSRGSLTGHVKVAATGTMDPVGNVGDVGGVAEKTVAVQRAGATVFIVPDVEVQTARQAATGNLTVVGVSTLAQALSAIERLGGTAPVPFAEATPGARTS